MKLHRKIPKTLLKVFPTVAAAALAAVALSGCVNDDSICPEPSLKDGKDVWLTMRISTLGMSSPFKSATRAEDGGLTADNMTDPSGHPEEAAIDAENYINLNDVEMVLLDEGMQVVKKFSYGEDYDITPWTTEGNNHKSYDLNFHFNSNLLFTNGDKVGMSLLMIANKNGMYESSNTPSPFTGLLGTHISKLASDTENNQFEYVEGKDDGSEDPAWMPNIDAGRHIPMCGIKTLTIDTAEFNKSTLIDLGTLDMQRVLAKIRVVDNFATTDEIKRIKRVRFQGMFKNACLLPFYETNQSWYTEGTKVLETASVPYEWDYSHAEELEHIEGTKSFVGYFPEYSRSIRWDIAQYWEEQYGRDVVPHLIITTEEEDGTETDFQVDITDKQLTNSILDMARNHIYEFIISGRTATSLDVTVNVKDWNDEEIIYDYTENVGVADKGELKWNDATRYSIIPETFTVIILPFGENETPTPLEGSFTLSSPVSGKWSASLIGIEGEPDAFYFIDDYGYETEVISGTITDPATPTNLRIVPRYPTSKQARSARLQVTVTLLNGQSIIADVVGSGGGGRNYATIKQNASM